ncbi:exodeoxyribonuclease III [Tepidamorphus sp. 3E244]|uniref:exodeoxyribonuclease III n=1 Tax=Tepidamorphus sp. 3E244 TaxID=3385498 RepID=UPI0038FCFAC6
MRIVSWNINSVRLRIDLLKRLTEELKPDVVCLQETKCRDDAFPMKAVRDMGFDHVEIFGQKGYHGVATLSRFPIAAPASRDFCAMGDCRHLATDIAVPERARPVRVHNYYVPAGGDEPDAGKNPKFAHKLSFLDEMQSWFTAPDEALFGAGDAILLGDLNIAPFPEDVWSHKQLLKVVSHTPIETEGLERVREAFGWVDLVRKHYPLPDKVFTWWSYRSRDWEAADKGRRLDHIWATPELAEACSGAGILKVARGWERPSDHAPIYADFA